MISFCWFCGKATTPESRYGAGRYDYRCQDCDVKWVTPGYWDESNAWKDQGGYKGYEEHRARLTRDAMRQYKLTDAGELVDFSKPGAPSSPA